jgi:hypothetical protein
MPFSFEKLMNKENEVIVEDEIINEDAEVIVEETQPLIEQPMIEDNGEAYFATKKIFLNGKHYFKDDMLDADVAQSDISFLLNRGLIVLHT